MTLLKITLHPVACPSNVRLRDGFELEWTVVSCLLTSTTHETQESTYMGTSTADEKAAAINHINSGLTMTTPIPWHPDRATSPPFPPSHLIPDRTIKTNAQQNTPRNARKEKDGFSHFPYS